MIDFEIDNKPGGYAWSKQLWHSNRHLGLSHWKKCHLRKKVEIRTLHLHTHELKILGISLFWPVAFFEHGDILLLAVSTYYFDNSTNTAPLVLICSSGILLGEPPHIHCRRNISLNGFSHIRHLWHIQRICHKWLTGAGPGGGYLENGPPNFRT